MDFCYYEHILQHICFLRLLTKKSLTANYIQLADMLINQFVKNFEKLYVEENMSSNLHAHLHLPNQCSLFGPLNKISCFPFEGNYIIMTSTKTKLKQIEIF